MNAAVNRSERRAFVAGLRSSRSILIFVLVLFALAPLALTVFQLRAELSSMDEMRVLTLGIGVLGLTLMIFSLVPFAEIPWIAGRFSPSGASRIGKIFGFFGAAFALGHVALRTSQLPSVIQVLPKWGVSFLPTPSFIGTLSVLGVILLLNLVLDVYRGGIFAVLRFMRFWLTLIAILFAALQAFHAETGVLPRALFIFWACYLFCALFTAFILAVILPFRSSCYEVTEAAKIAENGVEVTLTLRSGRGTAVRPGQSVGIAFGTNPFASKPLYYVSAVEENGIRIAIASGNEIPRIGTKVLAGTIHGLFRMDRLGHEGFIFIVNGYGIAPAMAVIRSLAEKNDRRSVYLLHGDVSNWFEDELNQLKERMKLTVMRVEGAAAVGFIGKANPDRLDVYVCAGGELKKAAHSMIKALKIPASNQWIE